MRDGWVYPTDQRRAFDPMAEDDGAAGILLLFVVEFHHRYRRAFLSSL